LFVSFLVIPFVRSHVKVIFASPILLIFGTRFVTVLRLPTPTFCLYEASLSTGF